MNFDDISNPQTVDKVIKLLIANGIQASLVTNSTEAKQKVLSMIPQGAEVMTMSSVTVDTLGLTEELNSEKYNSVHRKLSEMNKETERSAMKKIGSAPEFAVGSVHAVTEDGVVVIASNTGSQLPAYAYGSLNVIWVVGTHKIVPDLETAMKRIYDYILPKESARSNEAYKITTGSNVSKVLIINKEVKSNRLHLIFVPEPLGF